jgi:phage gpG-like protein
MPFIPNKQAKNIIKKKLERPLIQSGNDMQEGIQKNLNSSSGNTPKSRSGKLAKSFKVNKSNVRDLKISVESDSPYAKIQEFGGVIEKKTAENLKFQIGGNWVSVESVIIPARPYARPVIKSLKNKILTNFKGVI